MMHSYYVLVFDVFSKNLFLFSILEVFWDERQSFIFHVLQEELHKFKKDQLGDTTKLICFEYSKFWLMFPDSGIRVGLPRGGQVSLDGSAGTHKYLYTLVFLGCGDNLYSLLMMLKITLDRDKNSSKNCDLICFTAFAVVQKDHNICIAARGYHHHQIKGLSSLQQQQQQPWPLLCPPSQGKSEKYIKRKSLVNCIAIYNTAIYTLLFNNRRTGRFLRRKFKFFQHQKSWKFFG